MLRLFGPDCPTTPIDKFGKSLPKGAVWIDLLDPSDDEREAVEKLIGAQLPTRDELLQIEPSSRLYEKDGTAFMTMAVLHGMGDEKPGNDPVGFILTDRHLVSLRYIDPDPFILFSEHVYADEERASDPRDVLARLLDAVIDRLADEFENHGREIDAISKRIFDGHAHRSGRSPELRLEALLMRIGKAQQLLALLRDGSLSAIRLLTFVTSTEMLAGSDSARRHFDSLVADADALADHSNFLGDNLTFLLDASLGLINLEQNQVMKLFSVFAVVFLPPTLIAGIYGMNFEHMPELDWLFGYPYALILIVVSAVLPAWFARARGWL